MYEVFGFYRFLNIKYLKKNKRLINEVLIKNNIRGTVIISKEGVNGTISGKEPDIKTCLLYTSPSPRDKRQSRMPSSA